MYLQGSPSTRVEVSLPSSSNICPRGSNQRCPFDPPRGSRRGTSLLYCQSLITSRQLKTGNVPSSHSIENADSPTRAGKTLSLFTGVRPDSVHSDTSFGTSADVTLGNIQSTLSISLHTTYFAASTKDSEMILATNCRVSLMLAQVSFCLVGDLVASISDDIQMDVKISAYAWVKETEIWEGKSGQRFIDRWEMDRTIGGLWPTTPK
jgi:hypothetical protein